MSNYMTKLLYHVHAKNASPFSCSFGIKVLEEGKQRIQRSGRDMISGK